MDACVAQNGRLASIESIWERELAIDASLSMTPWLALSDELRTSEFVWMFSGLPFDRRLGRVVQAQGACKNCAYLGVNGLPTTEDCGSLRNALCEDDNVVEAIDYRVNAIVVETWEGMTCVLTQMRRVRCFGGNEQGQLGVGEMSLNYTEEYGESLRDVVGLEGVIQLDVGLAHACAMVVNGSVYCWGRSDVSIMLGSKCIGKRTNGYRY